MALKGRRATYDERLHAVRLLEQGESADEVARILNVSRRSLFGWQRDYRERGEEGLRTKKTRGPDSKLTAEQMSSLYALLVGCDPRQLSFGLALWTRKMVQELIWRRFAVRLSIASVGRVLAKLGMSPQKPLYKAYQQKPELVAQWKAEDYPKIVKEAEECNAIIFFADEAALSTHYHRGTTWAPTGRTPVVTHTGARRSAFMLSAVERQGTLRFQIFEESIKATHFIAFCKRLMSDSDGRPVFLILDNSRVHHAKIPKKFAADSNGMLRLFYLPAYSPELNPDEWVWKNVKHDRVGRAAVDGIQQMKKLILSALHSLQKTPALVQGFFHDPSLAYITHAHR
ncbi:IS630 family transposase [Nonomuraea sp. NPDC049141]|uniref:IS630 family transposase n=1 Tax=Nonomuraea sp. NPDC049141 TaxID=3155500 RepID=UPI0033E3AE83